MQGVCNRPSISHVTDTPENDSVVNSEEISPWEEDSEKEKDKTVSFVNKHLPRKRKRNRKKKKGKPCFSETIPNRLLRTYIRVLDRNGVVRRVQAALDTQSNMCLTRNLIWEHPDLGEKPKVSQLKELGDTHQPAYPC